MPAAAGPATIVPDATADGANPFASLLTALADAPAPAAVLSGPLPAMASPIVSVDPALATSSPEAFSAKAEGDGKADPEPSPIGPAATPPVPDLSAFLALIAPPPQISALPVRAASPSGAPNDGQDALLIGPITLP